MSSLPFAHDSHRHTHTFTEYRSCQCPILFVASGIPGHHWYIHPPQCLIWMCAIRQQNFWKNRALNNIWDKKVGESPPVTVATSVKLSILGKHDFAKCSNIMIKGHNCKSLIFYFLNNGTSISNRGRQKQLLISSWWPSENDNCCWQILFYLFKLMLAPLVDLKYWLFNVSSWLLSMHGMDTYTHVPSRKSTSCRRLAK